MNDKKYTLFNTAKRRTSKKKLNGAIKTVVLSLLEITMWPRNEVSIMNIIYLINSLLAHNVQVILRESYQHSVNVKETLTAGLCRVIKNVNKVPF